MTACRLWFAAVNILHSCAVHFLRVNMHTDDGDHFPEISKEGLQVSFIDQYRKVNEKLGINYDKNIIIKLGCHKILYNDLVSVLQINYLRLILASVII